jgi:hypothetical protein
MVRWNKDQEGVRRLEWGILEGWNSGTMELWKDGIMEQWITGKMREPGAKLKLASFQHSNIPIFQQSSK